MVAKNRRVYVCETLNRANGKWYVWFAHMDQAWVLQSMRVARHDHPGEKFRTVRYFPAEAPV